MKKTESIYLDKYNSMDEPDKYITDFLHETDSIGDALRDIADNATPVYIGDLIEWYKSNFRDAAQYCDDELEYYGAKKIQDAFSGGFFRWQLDKLEANKADIIEFWAWGYIFKILKTDEITDEQADAIESLDFDDYDSFNDLINDITEIINPDNE